jgi:hypothetical protein
VHNGVSVVEVAVFSSIEFDLAVAVETRPSGAMTRWRQGRD